MSTPGLSSPFMNAIMPAPSPPAAPDPSIFLISTPISRSTILAKCPSAESNDSTISGVAPFCGPYIADAPVGPVRGLFTSQAT